MSCTPRPCSVAARAGPLRALTGNPFLAHSLLLQSVAVTGRLLSRQYLACRLVDQCCTDETKSVHVLYSK